MVVQRIFLYVGGRGKLCTVCKISLYSADILTIDITSVEIPASQVWTKNLEKERPLYTIPELNHKELAPQLGEGRAVRARQCHFWNEYVTALQAFSSKT